MAPKENAVLTLGSISGEPVRRGGRILSAVAAIHSKKRHSVLQMFKARELASNMCGGAWVTLVEVFPVGEGSRELLAFRRFGTLGDASRAKRCDSGYGPKC